MKTMLFICSFFTFINLQAQTYAWVKSIGGAGSDDLPTAIQTDAADNVYTIGNFTGTADFDPSVGVSELTSSGYRDVYVSKLDAAGGFLWVKHFGGSNELYASEMTLDNSGNIYVVGRFMGTVDFDPSAGTELLTAMSSSDGFILKLNNSGSLIWVRQLSGSGYQNVHAVAVDAQDNVYTTGIYTGNVDFDPSTNTLMGSNNGQHDTYIHKMDAAGNLLWVKTMGGNGYDSGRAIELDGAGNVYLCGMFESTVDFDPTSSVASSLTSAGGRDGYIAKYNTTTGELLWTRRVGGTQKDELDGLTVSAQGAFATGKFQGTSDFDPDTAVASFTAVGGDDVCVVHLNASGNYVWAESLGSSDEDFAYATALDPAGDLYVTGFYSGAAAYSSGGAVLAHYGSEDMFLAKFSGSTGAIQWTEGLGDSATDERAIGLHVTNDYDIFVTGIYGGTVDFDPDSSATAPLTATDYQDGFVLKLTQPLLSTTSLASTSAALVAAVFPNPSTGSFTVELEQAYESLDVAVYSNTGQRLQEQHYNGQTVLQLHLPYAAGTYFVQLRTASGTSQVVAVQKR